MRQISLIIFAIIVSVIGTDSEIFAKTGSLNNNIVLAKNTVSTDFDRNNSSEITEGKISERKQITPKLNNGSKHYSEDEENQISSIEFKLSLIMVILVVCLAIMYLHGNRGNITDRQQFD